MHRRFVGALYNNHFECVALETNPHPHGVLRSALDDGTPPRGPSPMAERDSISLHGIRARTSPR